MIDSKTVFDSIAPENWDVWTWGRDLQLGRLDQADAHRLIRLIVRAYEGKQVFVGEPLMKTDLD